MNLYHFLPTQSEDLTGIKYYLHTAFQQISLSLGSNQAALEDYINKTSVRYHKVDFSDSTGNVGKIIPKGAYVDRVIIKVAAFDESTDLKVGTAADPDGFALVSPGDAYQTHRMIFTDSALIGDKLEEDTQAVFSIETNATYGSALIAIILKATL